MALLVAQVLFATTAGSNVQVDVVVLDGPEVPSRPPVGAPVCFEFALPGDTVWRAALSRILQAWADELAVVTIDLLDEQGRTLVQVATADAALTLEAPVA